MSQPTREIHYRYAVALLAAVCIVIVTVEWGGIDDLLRYLNFALALTSLALAVLAIVYAFLSNSSIGHSVSQVREAANAMINSSDALSDVVTRLEQHSAGLPSMISDVGDRVSDTQSMIQRLVASGMRTPPTSTSSASGDPVQRFLARCPAMGFLCIYAAVLAVRHDRSFSAAEVFRGCVGVSPHWGHGFLVACDTAGIIHMSELNEKVTVSHVDPAVSRAIPDHLSRAAARNLKAIGRNVDKLIETMVSHDIDVIERYFDEKQSLVIPLGSKGRAPSS